jgi:type I restriction enzyme R subunit
MTPEEKARATIDDLLTQCGWVIQDYKQLNLGAARAVGCDIYRIQTDTAANRAKVDKRFYADKRDRQTCKVALGAA